MAIFTAKAGRILLLPAGIVLLLCPVAVQLVFPGNAFGVVFFQTTAALLLITFTVVRGTANRADNNVVAIGKGLFADGAIVTDIVQKIISADSFLTYYIRNNMRIQIGFVSQK